MYSLHKVTVIVNGNEYTTIMPPRLLLSSEKYVFIRRSTNVLNAPIKYETWRADGERWLFTV